MPRLRFRVGFKFRDNFKDISTRALHVKTCLKNPNMIWDKSKDVPKVPIELPPRAPPN